MADNNSTSKPIFSEDPEVRRKLFWGAGLVAFLAAAFYHVTHSSKSYVKGHGEGFVSGYRMAGGTGPVASLPAIEKHSGRVVHQLAQDAETHSFHDED